MKGADFVWDEAKLDRFIANPEQIVPRNNMKPFSGLASADNIRNPGAQRTAFVRDCKSRLS
jgi:cytochrome c2